MSDTRPNQCDPETVREPDKHTLPAWNEPANFNGQTFVLYHGNCHDGFGAALCARLRLGEAAAYLPVNYGQPMPSIPDGSRVFILDFSYPRQELCALAARCDVRVLDHHHTAREALAGLWFARFDMEKSGARLAWEYFRPTAAVTPRLIEYIEDWDLWRFRLPDSRAFSAALQLEEFNFEDWEELLDDDNHRALAERGRAALKLKEKMVDAMCKNARAFTFALKGPPQFFSHVVDIGEMARDPHRPWNLEHEIIVPVANATVFFSEVGERLLELYPKAMMAAYYMDRADGRRQWGLRSRPGFDCSAVAGRLGGGGHKQAAGFITDRQ